MWKRTLFVFDQFNKDEIFTRASSLAYYTALAMAPIIVIMLWILSLLNLDLQAELIHDISSLIGEDGAEIMKTIAKGANERPDLSTLSGWIGCAGLLLSASVIFAQLQTTLNLIFDAESKTKKAASGTFAAIKDLVLDRLLSVGMLLTFLFLSIVSLAVSSGIAYFANGNAGVFAHALSLIINFVIFSAMFAVIYKWMPDRKISFHNCLMGAGITSVLFIIGKTAISLYLGKAGVGSAYGAAGSLVVLLVWVFYSSIIFFLGAEVTYTFLVKDEEKHSVK